MQPMVICDTNIISKYIVDNSEVQRQIHLIGLKNVIITPIVYIELMRWLSVYKGIPSSERIEIKRFIKGLKILHLNKGISELSIEISQKDLRNIIKQTIFAVGTDEKRKLYTGSLFDVDNTTLNVVSIDGYRLAIRKTEVVSNNSFKMVIPRKNFKRNIKDYK